MLSGSTEGQHWLIVGIGSCSNKKRKSLEKKRKEFEMQKVPGQHRVSLSLRRKIKGKFVKEAKKKGLSNSEYVRNLIKENERYL